mmetsp:Transcript_20565/g.41171  ORF Transcript_20565/g.41171 Transcript_20565/m.41171 type:complete len:400 (+) Transcript_20565:916-2115(+)
MGERIVRRGRALHVLQPRRPRLCGVGGPQRLRAAEVGLDDALPRGERPVLDEEPRVVHAGPADGVVAGGFVEHDVGHLEAGAVVEVSLLQAGAARALHEVEGARLRHVDESVTVARLRRGVLVVGIEPSVSNRGAGDGDGDIRSLFVLLPDVVDHRRYVVPRVALSRKVQRPVQPSPSVSVRQQKLVGVQRQEIDQKPVKVRVHLLVVLAVSFTAGKTQSGAHGLVNVQHVRRRAVPRVGVEGQLHLLPGFHIHVAAVHRGVPRRIRRQPEGPVLEEKPVVRRTPRAPVQPDQQGGRLPDGRVRTLLRRDQPIEELPDVLPARRTRAHVPRVQRRDRHPVRPPGPDRLGQAREIRHEVVVRRDRVRVGVGRPPVGFPFGHPLEEGPPPPGFGSSPPAQG